MSHKIKTQYLFSNETFNKIEPKLSTKEHWYKKLKCRGKRYIFSKLTRGSVYSQRIIRGRKKKKNYYKIKVNNEESFN